MSLILKRYDLDISEETLRLSAQSVEYRYDAVKEILTSELGRDMCQLFDSSTYEVLNSPKLTQLLDNKTLIQDLNEYATNGDISPINDPLARVFMIGVAVLLYYTSDIYNYVTS
jgi:hypothetical protein